MPAEPLTVHASAVSIDGRGVLVTGRSGAGKSSLALELIALGAELVADDRVELVSDGGGVEMRCPAPIRGLIEARGVGLLRAPAASGPIALALCADLDIIEEERMPPARVRNFLGHDIALVHRSGMCHFAAAIIVYLRFNGRAA